MKKYFINILIIMLAILLTGCGKDNQFAGEINVYTRDAASGTREAFQSIVGFESSELTEKAIETSGNGDQATKVGNDKFGIGYVSLSTDMAANNIKALLFNGIEATNFNVLNDTYQLKRPFNYVTRAENDFASDDVKNMTAAFIAYLGTKDGTQVLKANHVIVDDTNAPTWNSIKDEYPVITDAITPVVVRMGGSTSVKKSIEAAADAFKAVASKFDYTTNQTGSSDGYKRVLGENKDSNPVEIGFTSRTLKSSEDVTNSYKTGTYGIDAVALVVEKNNLLNDISLEDLKRIYVGEITKWEELVQ